MTTSRQPFCPAARCHEPRLGKLRLAAAGCKGRWAAGR